MVEILYREHSFRDRNVYSPGSSKPNIMGKYGSIIDIVVPMNSINPVNHWDPQTAR